MKEMHTPATATANLRIVNMHSFFKELHHLQTYQPEAPDEDWALIALRAAAADGHSLSGDLVLHIKGQEVFRASLGILDRAYKNRQWITLSKRVIVKNGSGVTAFIEDTTDPIGYRRMVLLRGIID